jgi:serine O-acetyltransferase
MNLLDLAKMLKADLLRLNGAVQESEKNSVNWLKVLNPRFHPVLFARVARYCHLNRLLRIVSPLFTWINVFIYGVEITPRCDIGAGLLLPHSVGTVIGAVHIGKNATILQGVTMGALDVDLNFDIELRPSLGDNVMVGAGAKLLGGISIGDNVKIGANAVVLQSVPANNTTVGVPAKISKANTSKK